MRVAGSALREAMRVLVCGREQLRDIIMHIIMLGEVARDDVLLAHSFDDDAHDDALLLLFGGSQGIWH